MIEVKASTRVKDYQVTDAGIQTWVARGAGFDVERIELAHINKPVRLSGRRRLPRPLHARRRDRRGRAAAGADSRVDRRRAARSRRPDAGRSPSARTATIRSPASSRHSAHPPPPNTRSDLLPHGRKLARQLRDEGFADLRAVPARAPVARRSPARSGAPPRAARPSCCPAPAKRWRPSPGRATSSISKPSGRRCRCGETRVRIRRSRCSGRATGRTPTARSRNRRPSSTPSGNDPRRAFAESLVAAIGDTGPIMVYNASFERGVLLQLAEAYADLGPALRAMADRLFDLLPLVRAHYYHPAMMGSWSIKRVLPTIAPDLDYANLDDVQSGDMVEPVYFEMIDPATSAERRKTLEDALRTYCARDTLALVKVAQFLAGADSAAGPVRRRRTDAGSTSRSTSAWKRSAQEPLQCIFLVGKDVDHQAKVRSQPQSKLFRMNVLRMRHYRRDNRAFAFEGPLFDHQEAVDKRWDRDSGETRQIDEQLCLAVSPAVCESARNVRYRFDKRTLAAGSLVTEAFPDFQMFWHVHERPLRCRGRRAGCHGMSLLR